MTKEQRMSVKNVNSPGKIHGGKGAPKATNDGKNLGRDATNTVMTLGNNPPELSPSSTKNSRNQR